MLFSEMNIIFEDIQNEHTKNIQNMYVKDSCPLNQQKLFSKKILDFI